MDISRGAQDDKLLSDIWENCNSDLPKAIKLFIVSSATTQLHIAALNTFKTYYEIYRDNMSIEALSQLAAVFTNEPAFKNEYSDICSKIYHLIVNK